ncbi:MAG: hypothetical protein JST00_13565 [Deltaproteobacteria bacterium]|nr:hypothetical protein [Deltaproteobacteria bacterium]
MPRVHSRSPIDRVVLILSASRLRRIRAPRASRGSSLATSCLLVVLALVLFLSACEGCRTPSTPTPTTDASEAVAEARLYLVSDIAGALEPCGCVKDQLGGMDHFGALLSQEKGKAKASALLTAGPLFFMDMEVESDRRRQEYTKAGTIAKAMKVLGLVAFAPGRNEWAGNADVLRGLVKDSAASLVAANLEAKDVPVVRWTKAKLGSIELGIVGVAAPDKAKVPLADVTSSAAADAVKAGVDALKKEGVTAVIALAAVGRGEAKRIADTSPDLLAIVVGSTGGSGDASTTPPPAERVGDVLIVETANHLQTVATLDLFPRAGGAKGAFVKFQDGTGIEKTRKREELSRRIDELRIRLATWEKDKTVDPKDVEARKGDLAKLEAERDALDQSPPPAAGSYYRYAMHEVREKLGADDAVKSEMLQYYKLVNISNKRDFSDRKPKPPAKGEAGYVGIDVCTNCHDDARKVWDGTAHAHAYATLEKGFKEYNLDCVSCHVTGYDRPGGSTVTHVDALTSVQCEVCHGPGQLHAAKPEKVKIPVAKPTGDVCLTCHHPPHVHSFDANAKMAEILGPGHGKPKK